MKTFDLSLLQVKQKIDETLRTNEVVTPDPDTAITLNWKIFKVFWDKLSLKKQFCTTSQSPAQHEAASS